VRSVSSSRPLFSVQVQRFAPYRARTVVLSGGGERAAHAVEDVRDLVGVAERAEQDESGAAVNDERLEAPQACGVQRHRAECVRFPRLLVEFPEEVEGLPPVADSLT
jgi:hypothetical protein